MSDHFPDTVADMVRAEICKSCPAMATLKEIENRMDRLRDLIATLEQQLDTIALIDQMLEGDEGGEEDE